MSKDKNAGSADRITITFHLDSDTFYDDARAARDALDRMIKAGDEPTPP